MNFSESERLCQLLKKSGWKQVENLQEAKVLIAVGCSVRQKAENRIISFLRSNISLKEKGTIFCLLGCTANLHREKLLQKLPFLDIVCSSNHIAEIPEILNNYENRQIIIRTGESENPFIECVLSSGKVTLTVPITKGCDNFCSYCVVPMARGKFQSRNPGDILREIKEAAENGVRAVMLLGQNVNEYGRDFPDGYSFVDLLCDVLKIDGILRIGFITSHPQDTSPDLLRIMATSEKIIKHLHIPLQSGSNRVLQTMNRKYTVEKFIELVENARSLMPEISITSDIMVGFPGETEEDFEQTLKIVREIRFNELFVFKYSARPMTKAFTFPETVSKEEKEYRHKIILETQKQISREILNGFLGKVCNVLVERKSIKNPHLLLGKNIQGVSVGFEGDQNLKGKIIRVKIISHAEGILYGKAIEECLSQQDLQFQGKTQI